MKADAAPLVEPEMSGVDWVLTSPARVIDWAAEALLDRVTLLVDLILANSGKTPGASNKLKTAS